MSKTVKGRSPAAQARHAARVAKFVPVRTLDDKFGLQRANNRFMIARVLGADMAKTVGVAICQACLAREWDCTCAEDERKVRAILWMGAESDCLVPDGCPDPTTGMPCNNCA